MLTARDIYANACGAKCEGDQSCHWCAGPCTRLLKYDGPPPLPFIKVKDNPARPHNPYVCVGCWLWRRKRITVFYFSQENGQKGYKDSQSPSDHSWWIADKEMLVLRPSAYPLLFETLLKPPNRFVLALKTKEEPQNHLHLARANDIAEITGDTPLEFTINNVVHSYTVYELTEALNERNTEPRNPGVRELIRFLGIERANPKKNMGGRPKKETVNYPTKEITLSGKNSH